MVMESTTEEYRRADPRNAEAKELLQRAYIEGTASLVAEAAGKRRCP